MREVIPIVSPDDFKDELKKMTPANTAMQNGGMRGGLNITQKTRANEAMLREPEVSSQGKSTIIGYFNAEQLHTQVRLYTPSKYIHMCVFIYAYVSTYIYIYHMHI